MSKNPMEQIPFDFDAPQPEPEQQETSLKNLDIPELEVLFKQRVGYDPSMRFLDAKQWGDRKALLIRGIKDPIQGKQDVGRYDAEYDGIGDPWSGK